MGEKQPGGPKAVITKDAAAIRRMKAVFYRGDATAFDDPVLGIADMVVHGDALVDVRPPTWLWLAIEQNLQAAKDPLRFVQHLRSNADAKLHEASVTESAARLGREASATVIILCATQFQSTLNWALSALDPALFGCSQVLVEEGRLRPIDTAALVYSACGAAFDTGDTRYSDLQLIMQIRNGLIHDKPTERLYEDASAEAMRWRNKLRARVRDLDYLPEVRSRKIPELFQIGNEGPVQKVMTFPVAKWAAFATKHVAYEIIEMVAARPNGLRLRPREQALQIRLDIEPWMAAGC